MPDNATAVGVPARVVRINGIKTCNLDQIHVSDPVAQELCRLSVEHTKLKLEVEDLKKQLAAATEQRLLPAPTENPVSYTHLSLPQIFGVKQKLSAKWLQL